MLNTGRECGADVTEIEGYSIQIIFVRQDGRACSGDVYTINNSNTDNANSPKSLFGIDSFNPIQISILDLEQLKTRRREFTFGDHLNQRDEKAVRKTVSGLPGRHSFRTYSGMNFSTV